MAFTQLLFQTVFATKYRARVLTPPARPLLFRYINGFCRQQKCKLHEVNCVSDHIHVIHDLHTTVAVARFVKDLKLATHAFIDAHDLFPDFDRWAVGYSCFSYSPEALPNLRRYVQRQQVHHGETEVPPVETSREELLRLLREHGIPFDPKYVE